jgi:nucleoside-diphosphate-sugar epimerase
MKVVVVGATGNVGTSVVQALSADPRVEDVVGVARRPGGLDIDGVRWTRADIRTADLVDLFGGAAAVVHLAWLIQPSHRPDVLASVNIEGTRRVCKAVIEAHVPALVYASSVGAYSPGPKATRVDENWPTSGIATSSYALHKAAVERMLDEFQAASPVTRVVRLRPGLIFKRSAGAQIRRYFLGRAAPVSLARPSWIPVVPRLPGLRFQIVHADDVAEAYRLAVITDASGAYNVAAEPLLDPDELAEILGARPVPVPRRLARAALWSTWRAHLQPTAEGWLDMALAVPLMATDRIRSDLGWRPEHDARTTLLELLDGLRRRESLPTAALSGTGPSRARTPRTTVKSA